MHNGDFFVFLCLSITATSLKIIKKEDDVFCYFCLVLKLNKNLSESSYLTTTSEYSARSQQHRYVVRNLTGIYFFAGLKPATLLKKRLCYRCFSVNFAKFLRPPFLKNTSWRLLLFFSKNIEQPKVSNYFHKKPLSKILHKKCSFPLRIYLVIMTKSAGNFPVK